MVRYVVVGGVLVAIAAETLHMPPEPVYKQKPHAIELPIAYGPGMGNGADPSLIVASGAMNIGTPWFTDDHA